MIFFEQSISYIKDVVAILTPIGGLIIAGLGLQTWRKELHGKTEYEIARKLLKSTYEYREALGVVRNPFMGISEMPQPPEGHPGVNDESMKRFYGIANAYEKRWANVTEAKTRLETELLEAEVLWGNTIKQKYVDLLNVGNKLFFNLKKYLESINPDSGIRLQYDFNVIYSAGENDDEYTKELFNAINAVEEIIKPLLNRKK